MQLVLKHTVYTKHAFRCSNISQWRHSAAHPAIIECSHSVEFATAHVHI